MCRWRPSLQPGRRSSDAWNARMGASCRAKARFLIRVRGHGRPDVDRRRSNRYCGGLARMCEVPSDGAMERRRRHRHNARGTCAEAASSWPCTNPTRDCSCHHHRFSNRMPAARRDDHSSDGSQACTDSNGTQRSLAFSSTVIRVALSRWASRSSGGVRRWSLSVVARLHHGPSHPR